MIEPGSFIIVSVMLQPFDYDPNEKSKHKFMVQTIFAPSHVTDMEAVWKDAKPDDLMDSKLRCIFELPSENDKVGAPTPGDAPEHRTTFSTRYLQTPLTVSSKTDLQGFVSAPSSEIKGEKMQNDIESSKATPVLNASKQDGSSLPKPTSMSLDDTEMRKLMEECKRLQSDVMKLSDENRQLKDDGLRMRKAPRSDNMPTNTGGLMGRDNSSSSLPSLLVVLAAIFIGFFLGKFIL
ncbi:vesicle-associated membrane protein-associated protein A-like isoform X4 [Acipenser ruthenus]|nr:vesicle-associated membrane protein-associated protein A-like isoform X4 [Acipenser ruthenus]